MFSGPIPLDQSSILQRSKPAFRRDHGATLPAVLVKRASSMKSLGREKVHVYDQIPRAGARKREIPILPIRWVLVEKSDPGRANVRCRPVGKESKAKTEGTRLAHEPFHCNDALGDHESFLEQAGEQRGPEQQQSRRRGAEDGCL